MAALISGHGSYHLRLATYPPHHRGRKPRWPRLGGAALLAASVSFEEDYPLLVRLLARGGVAPLARKRSPGDPLVLVGGVAATINPEPLAALADLIFLGEAEGGLPALLDLLASSRTPRGWARQDLLRRASGLPGVYVPSLYHVESDAGGRLKNWEPDPGAPPAVRPVCPSSLDDLWVAHLDLTERSPFRHSYLVEVGRGCPGKCVFCAARQVYPRVRWRDLSSLSSRIPGGARRLGLVGTAVSDHPQIMPAIEAGARRGLRVGVSSLRVGRVFPSLLRALAETGERTIALAPEAATDRLRRLLGKPAPEEAIAGAVEAAAAAGLRRIRLYFLLGVPGETTADVLAIAELAARLGRRARRAAPRGRRARVALSINPLVPKPHTPLELEALWSAEELRSRQKILAGELRRAGIDFRLGSVRLAENQALLSRGDRRVGEALSLGETEGLGWREALLRAGVDREGHLRGRRTLGNRPWGPTGGTRGEEWCGED